MKLFCLACRQPTSANYSYYCETCYIPTSLYSNQIYLGREIAYCPECNLQLSNDRNFCEKCNFSPSPSKPPKFTDVAISTKKLVTDIIDRNIHFFNDNRMILEFLDLLGLSELNDEDKCLTLISLAKEKMHFLSEEYNLNEAAILLGLSHNINSSNHNYWVDYNIKLQISILYIREGYALKSIPILLEIFNNAKQASSLDQLRKLELLSYIALAHSSGGNFTLSKEIISSVHEQTLQMFQNMEKAIFDIINHKNNEQNTNTNVLHINEYPRVDYIFSILMIILETSIIQNSPNPTIISQDTLGHLMEIDNLIFILGEFSNKNNPLYFFQYFRDYVRIFNGLFWYGDLLLNNDQSSRIYLIENYYQRVKQWSSFTPIHNILLLRPARFLDIFIRTSAFLNIDYNELYQIFIDKSPIDIIPQWGYIVADALSKNNNFDKAMEELNKLTDPQNKSQKYIDEEFRIIITNLKNSILLTSLGLFDKFTVSSSIFEVSPIYITLEDNTELIFNSTDMSYQLATYFENLFNKYNISKYISKIDSIPINKLDLSNQIIILNVNLSEGSISFLFELLYNNDDITQPKILNNQLYYLKGVSSKYEFTSLEIQKLFIKILTKSDFTKNHVSVSLIQK